MAGQFGGQQGQFSGAAHGQMGGQFGKSAVDKRLLHTHTIKECNSLTSLATCPVASFAAATELLDHINAG